MHQHINKRALSIIYNYLISINYKDYYFILPTNICHDVYFFFKAITDNIIFIDIAKQNLELDKQKVRCVLQNNNYNYVLVWNHTYGNEDIPYDFFKHLKNDFPDKIKIIDDRCLCNPLFYKPNVDNKHIDLIVFSTGYAKQIDLNGGGFGFSHIKLNNKAYDFNKNKYSKIKSDLLNEKKVDIETIKNNFWVTNEYKPMQVQQYLEKIKAEDKRWLKHKNIIKEIYQKELKDFALNDKYNNWRYNILVKNKNELLTKIFNNKLYASGHYPSIGTILNNDKYPKATWIEKHIINLFIDKHFTFNQAIKLSKLIKENGHPF